MAIKKRCIRCMKYLRDDGTCQNPNCVKYVPEGVSEIPPDAVVVNIITREELDKIAE